MDVELSPVTQLGDSARAFVVDSWVRARLSEEPKSISRALFLKTFPQVVRAIVGKGDALVAHFPDNPELYVGWVAFDRRHTSRLHYLYVKKNFRRHGVASRLLAELGPDPTMSLAPRKAWARTKAESYGYRYDPYQLFLHGESNGSEEEKRTA